MTASAVFVALDADTKLIPAYLVVSINCAFCANFKFESPLLGQSGFFSNFVTTFHQPKHRFEITPYNSLRRRK